jgi:hypothetical protein
VEESRTNLIRYSIISTVAGWPISGSTVTNNATTAPDGTNTAARIQVDPGGYVADTSISVTAGQTYTFSFWVKSVSGSGTWGINIYDHGGANIGHHRTTVNITEEWQRVSYTYTPTGTAVNVYVSDDREGLATISDAYVWGAQLEQKSFVTSLIPTEGSEKTRTADNASITGSNFTEWYNQSEGTVYVRYAVPSFPFTNRTVFGISSSFSNRINARLDNQNIITPYIVTNSSVTSAYNLAIRSGAINSTAYTFSENSSQSSTNGALAVSGTQQSVSLPICDTFSIGSIRNAEIFCSTISQLTYYPQRLTNTQLQTLTK